MKLLVWTSWILVALAAVIILLGAIAILSPGELFLGFRDYVNFYHAANTLLLMAIALILISGKGLASGSKS